MLVPRQTTPYTCGAACLAMVYLLWKNTQAVTEAEIAKACNAKPQIGIDNAVLAQWARENLPVTDDRNSYPAIWNIRNPLSGVGHYVVVLGERSGRVRYYDPLYACVQEFDKADIDWRSGCGTYHQWSINFTGISDHYDTPCVGEPFLNVPAGHPVPEFVFNSVLKYLAKHGPSCDP